MWALVFLVAYAIFPIYYYYLLDLYLQTGSDNLDDPQSAPFTTAQLNTN